MILIIAFVAISSITFGVMALVMNTSRHQRAIERRVISIRSPSGEAGSSGTQVEQLLKVDPESSFGWLDEVLQKYPISQILTARIVQADIKISVGKLLLVSIGLAVCGYAAAYLCVSIWIIQAAVACLFFYVPYGFISFKRSRRIAAFNARLPDAIDMMGRALRAGHSMTASINMVAEQSTEPVTSEFREVFKQQNFGFPLRDALMQMLDHVPSQDLRVLVTGILVQKETGGNLAEILDRTAAVIRERLRIQGDIRTHTAQGRITGWVLCMLPPIMLLAINIINPGYSNVLVDTPVGHMLIYVGLFLLTTGGLIIRQIINGIEV